jgi:hypothetical protein
VCTSTSTPRGKMNPTTVAGVLLLVWVAACFKAAWDTASAEFGDSHAFACRQLVAGGPCTQLPGGLLEGAVSAMCHTFRETCATPRVVTLTKHTFAAVTGNVLQHLPTHLIVAAAVAAAALMGIFKWCTRRTRAIAPTSNVLEDAMEVGFQERLPQKPVPWTPKQD